MCDKSTHDSRLIYPEVQPPSEPYDPRRNRAYAYDEVPVHDRTSTASSVLTEDSPRRQPQDHGIIEQPSANNDDIDLFEENLKAKNEDLQKWQRKLRKCSCCIKLLAFMFMVCAAVHLLFPAFMMKKMRHGHHGGPHHGPREGRHGDNRPENDWEPHHGDRHLRSDFHDDEFFVVEKKMPSFVFDEDT